MRRWRAVAASLALAAVTLAGGCAPKQISFEDARPYAVAWAIDNCKEYRCDNQAGPYGAVVDSYEHERGWVFVFQLKPEREGGETGQLHLLVPHKNPRQREVLEG